MAVDKQRGADSIIYQGPVFYKKGRKAWGRI